MTDALYLIGFGGSNAHAIVESYTPTSEKAVRRSSTVAIPFLFSANSEKALVAQLKSHLNFLEHVEEGTNARDVAWTLSCRSTFACRTSFSASTLESLYEKLKQAVDAKEADNIETGIRPLSKRQKIFGVFTGQGAQWPMMGYNLIQSSPVVHATAELLDKSLQSLPEEDRPSWSLIEELSKSPGVSRVMQAELSQPLCTAVQIFLVDILHTAGVGFNAVVGHSSGKRTRPCVPIPTGVAITDKPKQERSERHMPVDTSLPLMQLGLPIIVAVWLV